MQPLFSVLIANYNNGKYIAECLDSVLKQDYPNIEIVIVDDASTDQSLNVVDSYLKNNSIKLYKNTENKGVGYTKKRCIEEASGAICGFVDPDDAIAENAVSLMVAAHQKNADTSLIYSNYYDCQEDLSVVNCYQSQQVTNGKYEFFNEQGFIGPFATFKKQYYNKTLGLNETLKRAIDQDLYLKLYDVGACLHLPKALYYYRIHQNGLATNAQADLAYYWYWVVCILRAQDKGINLEQKFVDTFARKNSVRHLLAINNGIRKSFIFKSLKKWLK